MFIDYFVGVVFWSVKRIPDMYGELYLTKAAGYHAKSNIGCTCYMLALCICGVVFAVYIVISIPILIVLYGVSFIILALYAPNGKIMGKLLNARNRKDKRYISYFVLTVLFGIAYYTVYRELVVFSVLYEVGLVFTYYHKTKGEEYEINEK